MGLVTDKQLDAKQMIDYFNSVSDKDEEIQRLKDQIESLESSTKETRRKVETYDKYKDILEGESIKYYQITLRESEALRQFEMKMRKEFNINLNDDGAEKKAKTKEANTRFEAVINYLFAWVAINPVRWNQMITQYKAETGDKGGQR
jgi:malonyl CoA-acyl carrier protein transacylase